MTVGLSPREGEQDVSLGRAVGRADIVLKDPGPLTATANGAFVELGDAANLAVLVDITAVSGTAPTLDIRLEGGNTDALPTGAQIYEFGRIGANGYRSGNVGTGPPAVFDPTVGAAGVIAVPAIFACPRWVRLRSIITGTTPSFTFSVTGEVAI